MNAIISLTLITLFVFGCALVAYIAPKVIDFVKAFIRWHSYRG